MIKRKYKRIGKGWITNSHYVWNKHHPEDPIEKGGNGFVIHHKDENKKNDDISNLVKMSDFKHRSLHSKGGANALAKWRKENPEKARKQSQENARKSRVTLDADPERKKRARKNRSEAAIKSNKARKLSEEERRKRSTIYMRNYRRKQLFKKIIKQRSLI